MADGGKITAILDLDASRVRAGAQEAGLELSDIQLTSIFNYSQRGSKVLQSFRD